VVDGEVLTPRQQDEINRAIDIAQRESGLTFTVYVGPAPDDLTAFARQLLAALPDPEQSVVVLVDPTRRRLEIVTGGFAARNLNDRACALAAAAMTSAFAAGDLSGGVASGVVLLGEQARHPRSLHLDQP
jgi:uncharacterized membrane protein YgcG